MSQWLLLCCCLVVIFPDGLAFIEPGKWNVQLTKEDGNLLLRKSLFRKSQIFVQISCKSNVSNSTVDVQWLIRETACWNEMLADAPIACQNNDKNTSCILSAMRTYKCNEHIILEEVILETESPSTEHIKQTRKKRGDTNVKDLLKPSKATTQKPIFTIPNDGIYFFSLFMSGRNEFTADVQVEMIGTYGYLSAADYPLLPFYGAMCLVYVIFGIAWLLVSFYQWKDLLRIQFWIGGVILLGMLEKATFYAEYQSINNTGDFVPGAMFFAELTSCGKRTLARMLVIIVSLGFGIVKPRLGLNLHRVVGVGICYFILAAIESYLRIMRPVRDISSQVLIALIPLELLNSGICWWIFYNLVQTIRTLRLRNNLVKLSLYHHFTNTLIFSVIASVIFMMYSIKEHRAPICLTDWKELWVEDAFWHVLFSIILLVIMILWRPTNNNQRYAFTPLINSMDDDDDEDEDHFVNDAFGVKMRGVNANNSRANSPKPKLPTSDEDILIWVDENIPSAGLEAALPLVNSDEELETTKMELSKTQ